MLETQNNKGEQDRQLLKKRLYAKDAVIAELQTKYRKLKSDHTENRARILELEKTDPSARAKRNALRLTQRAANEATTIRQAAKDDAVQDRRRAAKGQRTEVAFAKLEDKVKKQAQMISDLQAEVADWETEHQSAETFELAWSLEEMNSWGPYDNRNKGENPYPPEVVMLGMELCSLEAMASQVPSYIKMIMATYVPALENMPVPTSDTIRTWRLGLLPLSDLITGVKIANTKNLTLHQDGTSKWQRKLACAVLDTDDGLAMANGVYTQKGGTAKETAKLIFKAAFETPQATMESARTYLSKQEDIIEGKSGDRHSTRLEQRKLRERPDLKSWIPDDDIVAKIVGSEIPINSNGIARPRCCSQEDCGCSGRALPDGSHTPWAYIRGLR